MGFTPSGPTPMPPPHEPARTVYPPTFNGSLLQRRNGTVVRQWCVLDGSAAPAPAPSMTWVADDAWFEERVQWYMLNAPVLNVTRPATKYQPPQLWSIRGCCPAAASMWPDRHGHRCCSEKWHRLLQLRPVGGMDLHELASRLPSGRSVVIIGDSMGQQQFVALLCLAWSSAGFEYRMHSCDDDPELCSAADATRPAGGDTDESRSGEGASASRRSSNGSSPLVWATITRQAAHPGSQQSEDAARRWRLRLLLLHGRAVDSLLALADDAAGDSQPHDGAASTTPAMAGTRSSELERRSSTGWSTVLGPAQRASVLLFNAWQHALPSRASFTAMLKRVARRWPHTSIVLTEALLNHFPGGSYIMAGRYPGASCPVLSPMMRWEYPVMYPCVCDQWWTPRADARQMSSERYVANANGVDNRMIDAVNEWLRNVTSVTSAQSPATGPRLLRLSDLFRGRGEAHVEWAWNPFVSKGRGSQRDCLHLCVRPPRPRQWRAEAHHLCYTTCRQNDYRMP